MRVWSVVCVCASVVGSVCVRVRMSCVCASVVGSVCVCAYVVCVCEWGR